MKFEVALYFANKNTRIEGVFLRHTLNSQQIMEDFIIFEKKYHKLKGGLKDLVFKNDFYEEKCLVESSMGLYDVFFINELFDIVKQVHNDEIKNKRIECYEKL